ncbi:MAG TPA: amidohydrolase [Devosiaceae bacterium]|nr:amidohydrolase [Devosiaceae bacterium]
MTSLWLENALCLLQEGDAWSARPRSVEIVDGTIVAIHDPAMLPPTSGVEVIQANGLLAVPGFVNAHSHSPDNLIRGSAPNLPLELWSLHSAAGRNDRTEREAYIAAMLGAIEMLRCGTTGVLDHVRISPDIEGARLDAVASAYRDIGMRAVVAPIVADRAIADTMPLTAEDLGDIDIAAYGRRAPLPAAEQIAIAKGFAAAWDGRDGRITTGIGPSAPQRCTDELLELAADLSARRALTLHMHLLETRAQRALGFERYGKGTIAHLIELGVVGPRTTFAHAIWIEPGDIERLARAGAGVVHNPVSNARLGSGVCPLPRYLSAGVRIGLGTDSACCNDSNNLLETAKWATLLHNLEGEDADWISPGTALELITGGSADVTGLGTVTGRLAPGFRADITLFRLASPAFVPLIDPVRQLIQAENGAAVERVIVDGRTVYADGRITTVDEAAIWAEAAELAERRLHDNAETYRQAAALEVPIRRMYRRLATEHEGCVH